jgi:myosin I
VTYNVDMFLEKNKDTLFNDITNLFQNSSSSVFIKQLFPVVQIESKKRPPTAGSQFKTQVLALVETLMACHPHYIRCVRPNARKAPQSMERDLTMNQVKYLGLVENVRVRRAGYAYRQTYEKFFMRFRLLSKRCFPKYQGDPKSGCKLIMEEMKIPPQAYEFGNTKIFIRHPQIVGSAFFCD